MSNSNQGEELEPVDVSVGLSLTLVIFGVLIGLAIAAMFSGFLELVKYVFQDEYRRGLAVGFAAFGAFSMVVGVAMWGVLRWKIYEHHITQEDD